MQARFRRLDRQQWAALGDDGRYRSGRLDAPGGQWLELARVVIEGDELDIRTGGRPKR